MRCDRCVRAGFFCFLAMITQMMGCAGSAPTLETGNTVTRQMLLEGIPLVSTEPLTTAPIVDLLHLTDEMKAFVDFYVDPSVTSSARLRQLQSAIVHNHAFRVNYSNQTLTAAQTFALGEGNCLSFTNMFIAMARYAGLKARYQEVEVPPVWETGSGTMILSRHINVYVRMPSARSGGMLVDRVVDFNNVEIDPSYRALRLSDRRALAVYYSNLGIELLHHGRLTDAFAYLKRGLQTDDTFHDLWINLGALYSRVGALDYAEQAYFQALRTERSMIGLSNLVRIYELQGRPGLADRYRDLVAEFRDQNPYYRYQLAKTALEDGAPGTAIEHMHEAIRLKSNVGSFYFLLGLAYWQDGQRETADEWLSQARALAADDKTRRRYDHKIRLLGGEVQPHSRG